MANKRKALTPDPSLKTGKGWQGFPKGERNRLIKLIHIGKRDLKLDDDAYRALLEGVTGQRSCSDLDEVQLDAVVKRMRELGFVVKAAPKGKRSKKLSPQTRGKRPVDKTQIDLIRALWINCYQVGLVRNRYEAGLNGFVKKLTKIERVDWIRDAATATRVIETLKAMLKRKGVEWEPGDPAGRGTKKEG